MTFIKHIECTFCGSSDGRALYEGGSSFCFVCRKPLKGNVSPYLLKRKESFQGIKPLPDDNNTQYPEHVLNWVFSYEITIPELIKHHVTYSQSYDQLIFSWYDASSMPRQPFLWQGRNFSKEAKSKCYTSGNVNECIPLYECLSPTSGIQETDRNVLVIVEDPISAIKIARQTVSMPVLGSDLSLAKINRIAALPEASKGIVVWLDGNMFHKAQKIAQRFQLLDVPARAVYTEKDPKCYKDAEVKDVIFGNSY